MGSIVDHLKETTEVWHVGYLLVLILGLVAGFSLTSAVYLFMCLVMVFAFNVADHMLKFKDIVGDANLVVRTFTNVSRSVLALFALVLVAVGVFNSKGASLVEAVVQEKIENYLEHPTAVPRIVRSQIFKVDGPPAVATRFTPAVLATYPERQLTIVMPFYAAIQMIAEAAYKGAVVNLGGILLFLAFMCLIACLVVRAFAVSKDPIAGSG